MAETSPLTFVTDRSRITTDWACPRKRYYQYHYAGKGIINNHTSLELFLGTTIHDALAAIAVGTIPIDTIAVTANQQMRDCLLHETQGEVEAITFANEQGALVEGMVRGFYKHVWPRLRAEYPRIIAAERECRYTLSDSLTFMARPDLVMEDKEGNWVYVEYKTTSSKKEGWVNSWNTAVQLHSSIKAVEETLGTAPTTVIVQGLYKGYESYGKQNSPYCYAYKRTGTPPFTKDEVRYDYTPGFKRSPTWEMEGGVAKWVAGMPETVLADQYPQAPPIFVKEDLVNNFFAQVNVREQEIQMALAMLDGADEEQTTGILNTAFEQHFDECQPYFGRGCTYRRICHGHVADPLSEGYEPRQPHHQPEVDLWLDGGL